MAELRRVGNFDVMERIGRGGMGAVFKARQINMDRIVALKILPPNLARQPTFIERFLREARASAKLNHPNIVNGIDVGSANGLYYFAMEYIEGSSLKAVIDREERLDEARAIGIAREIALALDHAHSNGILHRDIKPENILIQKDGSAKLCDLGLAHLATERDADKDLTQSGKAVGTPHYISPEQARGLDNLDATSDLYSLGATLYHMVTGVTLFQGGTAVSIMSKHLTEKAVDPGEFGAEMSDGLLKILGKLLTKDHADRYPSATKLAQDLERVGSGEAPRFAELDSAKWPFKGRPPATNSGTARKPEMQDASRKTVMAAVAATASAEKPARTARRAGRPERSNSLPAAALILVGLLLAGGLIAATQLSAPSENEPAKPQRTTAVKLPVSTPSAPLSAPEPAEKKPATSQPSQPSQPSHGVTVLAAPSETMEALASLGKSRVTGESSVEAPPANETAVVMKPSLAVWLSEARVSLRAGEFKPALAKIEDIRREFAGSSELIEYATEIGRIHQAASDGAAGVESPKPAPSVVKAPTPEHGNQIPASMPVKAADVKKPEAAPVPTPAKEEPRQVVDLMKSAAKQVNAEDNKPNSGNFGNGFANNFFFNKNNELAFYGSKTGTLDMGYKPPEEYDYKLAFRIETTGPGDHGQPPAPFGYVMMYVPMNGKSLAWFMPYGSGYFAFDQINHTHYREQLNPTRVDHARLKPGTTYNAEIKVRRDTVTTILNAETILVWRRDGVSPTGEPEKTINEAADLGIGAMNRINLHVISASVEYGGPKEK